MITGNYRSRSFGILYSDAFYSAENEFWYLFGYIFNIEQLFGKGLRASGFL